MKTLLILSLLAFASCGKDIMIQTIAVPAEVEDTSLQCQIFDLVGVPGVPVFKNLTSIGLVAVNRIDSISSATNVAFKPFENTEFVNLTENFGLSCNGVFEATESGTYTFAINSDDGSTLSLGNTKIIDNNTDHAMVKKSASVLLLKGKYNLNTTYYNHGGAKGFVMSYKRPGSSLEEILKF
jgi:hypothetical protein